jgi:hypothetical protein
MILFSATFFVVHRDPIRNRIAGPALCFRLKVVLGVGSLHNSQYSIHKCFAFGAFDAGSGHESLVMTDVARKTLFCGRARTATPTRAHIKFRNRTEIEWLHVGWARVGSRTGLTLTSQSCSVVLSGRAVPVVLGSQLGCRVASRRESRNGKRKPACACAPPVSRV